MSDASTLIADGRYPLVLDGLHQGAYANFGDKGIVQIYLNAESGKTPSDIVYGASINLEKIT